MSAIPHILKAAVIGGGAIGALMDLEYEFEYPQTHAGAYRQHEAFDLVGIFDLNPAENIKCWDTDIFDSLEEMMSRVHPDVISVAVPEKHQYGILKKILDYTSVKAVIAEKPLADNIENAKEIVANFEEVGIPLFVNYTRRYSNIYADLSKNIHSDRSRVISASVRYGKGLWHNGTHGLDLALFLFGDCLNYKLLSKKHDFFDKDASYSAFLEFKHCPQFFLQALNERCYTLFEVDVFTEKERFIFSNDHREISLFKKQDSAGIPKGMRLVHESVESTDYELCMMNLMQDVVNVLQTGSEPKCSGRTALKSLELAHELIKS